MKFLKKLKEGIANNIGIFVLALVVAAVCVIVINML